jgi:hypothetical protein
MPIRGGERCSTVAAANATTRTLAFNPRESERFYYLGSAWETCLWEGG